MHHRAHAIARSAAALTVALAICGCGGKKEPRLVDYLEQLEFDVPLETATYVPLGRFDIPLVADKAPHTQEPSEPADEHSQVWMRVQFELTAETTPKWKDAVIAAAEHHQGGLNDAVLTVVRTSPVNDLSDPRLLSVNARLTDIIRPMLGEDRVRRLMFTKLDQAAMEAASKKKKNHGAEEAGEGGEPGKEHGDDHDSGHDGEKSEARGDGGHH